MHKLKEMLMNELHEYEEKAKRMNGGKLSISELDKIHKLTDTVKNICKIDMLDEESDGYSEDGTYMGEGRIYGTSYARGRRNARRDRMGRYSSDDGMSYDDDMSYARDGRGGNRGMRGNRGYSRDDIEDKLIETAEEMLPQIKDPRKRKLVEKLIDDLDT